MSAYPHSLQNQFLIAMPQMQDPTFAGTLTFICDHNEHGAMGIVVNRPLTITLHEILEQLELDVSVPDAPVFAGGPVQTDRGFVLHHPRGRWQSSIAISEDICLTTSRDILAAMATDAGPQHALIALGYAGWGAGQLEQEMASNAWLTCPATPQILFHTAPDKKLDAALASLGVDPHRLSGQVGHA